MRPLLHGPFNLLGKCRVVLRLLEHAGVLLRRQMITSKNTVYPGHVRLFQLFPLGGSDALLAQGVVNLFVEWLSSDSQVPPAL